MTNLFADSFFDVVAIVVIVLLAGWLWNFIKKKHISSTADQDGEQWEIVEFRAYGEGHVFLSRSLMNGRWSVNGNLSPGSSTTTTIRYATEQQAREAFAKYRN